MDPNVEAALVGGAVGAVPGIVAIVYARLQVREMARQTEESRRVQHYAVSHDLMVQTTSARQAWVDVGFREATPEVQANPAMARGVHAAGSVRSFFVARSFVEHLQEMYFARSSGVVTDIHWRGMHRIVRAYFGPRLDHELWDVFREMGYFTPEFVAFLEDYRATSVWKDPLGRLPSEHAPPLVAH
jgi:hypothetical protein